MTNEADDGMRIATVSAMNAPIGDTSCATRAITHEDSLGVVSAATLAVGTAALGVVSDPTTMALGRQIGWKR